MSINENYYGNENTWETLYSDNTYTDNKFPRFGTNVPTYGVYGAIALGTKVAIDFPDNFNKSIDLTCCWCCTDGTAPYDKTLYNRGITSAYSDISQILSDSSTANCIFAVNNASSFYNNYIQYYTARTATTIDNPPLRYNYSLLNKNINIRQYSDDTKYITIRNGNYSPSVKFDFKKYICTPYIEYIEFQSGKSVSDLENIQSTNDISAVINTTHRCDLATYLKNNLGDTNNVITRIFMTVQQLKFVNGQYSDMRVITANGFLSTKEFEYTFNDYNDEEHTVKIDENIKSTVFSSANTTVLVDSTQQTSNVNLTNCCVTLSGLQGSLYTNATVHNQNYNYNLYSLCVNPDFWNIKEINYQSSAWDKAFLIYQNWKTKFSTLSDFADYVRKCVAFTGMYFTDSYHKYTVTETLDGTNVYLGVVDSNGITHGQYTHGTDNLNQQQNAWNDDVFEKTPYNPNKPQPADEKDRGDLTTHLNSGYYETSAIYYATTETQIRKFIDFMNTYSPSDADLISDFKGVNPSDYITNVLYFPFDVMYSGAAQQIYLSVLNTTATGLKFSSTYGITYVDFGSIFIERYFNDFRDFAPYTKLSVDIPFSSTVDLDISEFYNHYLNIKMCIDFTTGDTISLISRDNLVVKTVTGNCAVQLPVSALSMATYQETINTLQSNAKINQSNKSANDIITVADTGVALATMAESFGLTGAIANPVTTLARGTAQRDTYIEQGKQIDYSLKHTTPSPVAISGGTPNSMMMLEYIPRYTITRCKSLNSINFDAFGKTTGYATVQQGIVSDFSGLIVCADVEFNNISATATEQDMIKNILKSGVVV
jgi:hypothetical protein